VEGLTFKAISFLGWRPWILECWRARARPLLCASESLWALQRRKVAGVVRATAGFIRTGLLFLGASGHRGGCCRQWGRWENRRGEMGRRPTMKWVARQRDGGHWLQWLLDGQWSRRDRWRGRWESRRGWTDGFVGQTAGEEVERCNDGSCL
jgi:hypothetical protein